jgi:hypothetical protein
MTTTTMSEIKAPDTLVQQKNPGGPETTLKPGRKIGKRPARAHLGPK